MKVSNSKRDIRGWGGNNQSEFQLFYLSGSLLKALNELANEGDQADFIASLIRERYYQSFGRYPDE